MKKLLLRIDKTSTGLGLQRDYEIADIRIINISLPLVGNIPMYRSHPPENIC